MAEEGDDLGDLTVKIRGDDSSLMNTMGQVSGKLIAPAREAANLVQAVFSASFKNVGENVSFMAADVGAAFGAFGSGMSSIAASGIESVFAGIGAMAGGAIRAVGSLAAGVIAATTHFAGEILQDAGQTISNFTNSVNTTFEWLAAHISDFFEKVMSINPLSWLGASLGFLTGMVGTAIGLAFTLVGNTIGAALQVIGGAVMRIGELLAGVIQSVTDMAASIAETAIPLIGDALGGIIRSVGGGIANFFGSIMSAVTGPVRQAMAASLTDFDRWITAAIKAEASLDSFNDMLEITGGVAGYTAEQLKHMADVLGDKTVFGVGEIRSAQQELMKMDKVRGDVFSRAIEASANLADAYGRDLVGTISAIGYALQDPERGVQRLQRTFRGMFTVEDVARIKSTNSLLDQQGAILDVIAKKGGHAADVSTTEERLAKLAQAWEKMGKNIGKALLPITGLVTDVMLSIVRTASDIVKPVFADITAAIAGWVEGARAWLKENEDTWVGWATSIRQIVGNLWAMLKQGLSELFGGMNLDGAVSFWEAIKKGVTDVLQYLAEITSSWEIFRAVGELAWLTVKKAAMDLWESTTDRMSGVWEVFKAGAVEVFNYVKTLFIGLMEIVGKALANELSLVPRRVALAALEEVTPSDQAWHVREKRAEVEKDAAYSRSARAIEFDELIKKTSPPDLAKIGADALAAATKPGGGGGVDETPAQRALGLEIAGLSGQIMLMRRDAAAAMLARQKEEAGIDMKPKGPPTPDDKPVKFDFRGFADMWKKTQESITGGSLLQVNKDMLVQLQEINKKAPVVVNAAAGGGDKMERGDFPGGGGDF